MSLSIHEPDLDNPVYSQTMEFDFRFQARAGRDEGMTKRWCFACS